MKLEYNILWIDDHLDRLKTLKREFKGVNESVGISVYYDDLDVKQGARETAPEYITRITNEVQGRFKKGLFYDLILVDLHFGPEEDGVEIFNGSNIVEIIRDTHSIYRPIIFYSSGSPETQENAVNQLKNSVENHELSGKSVFTRSFEDLGLFLERIASEMHQEEHKVNHVRGLLMDQVSEFDAKIVQLIKNDVFWNIVTDENKQKKVVDEFQRVAKQRYETSEEVFKVAEHITYEGLREYIKAADHKTIDTFTRSKMLREILRSYSQNPSLGTTLSKAIQGSDESKVLTKIRNVYAHETSKVLDKEHHSPEKCKYIREECRKQIQNILKVESIS